MISQVESFLCPDKQGIPEEGRRIQQVKHFVKTNNNKDEDNSLKNNTQYIIQQTSTQKFRHISWNYFEKEYCFKLVKSLSEAVEIVINLQWEATIY